MIVDRESKSILNRKRLVGREVRELDFIISDGDIRIIGRENNTDIVHDIIAHIIKGKCHGNGFTWIEFMVVISCRVVDFEGVILDGAQLNGFDSRQSIDTTKTVYIALARGQRYGCLFKDAAHISRHQVDVLAQHQGHATSDTGRGHRCAAHGSVTRIALVIQRLDINTRGTHIGTNKTDARIVRIVAKLGIRPSDRTMGGEIGGCIVVIDSTNAHRATQITRILALNIVHIRRRTAAWDTNIVRNRILVLAVAFIARSDGGHNTGIQGGLTSMTQQSTI